MPRIIKGMKVLGKYVREDLGVKEPGRAQKLTFHLANYFQSHRNRFPEVITDNCVGRTLVYVPITKDYRAVLSKAKTSYDAKHPVLKDDKTISFTDFTIYHLVGVTTIEAREYLRKAIRGRKLSASDILEIRTRISIPVELIPKFRRVFGQKYELKDWKGEGSGGAGKGEPRLESELNSSELHPTEVPELGRVAEARDITLLERENIIRILEQEVYEKRERVYGFNRAIIELGLSKGIILNAPELAGKSPSWGYSSRDILGLERRLYEQEKEEQEGFCTILQLFILPLMKKAKGKKR